MEVLYSNSDIKFDGSTFVRFDGCVARFRGGAIEIVTNSIVIFQGNCKVDFSNNRGSAGPAICSSYNCDIFVNGNSVVTFHDNIGGPMVVGYF